MNRFLPILATIEMSENDKRALIALVIILVILFVLIGLLGMAVRKTMAALSVVHQSGGIIRSIPVPSRRAFICSRR